jgi:hypothetical protein
MMTHEMSAEERVDLLHEVIELLPHDRRYLEEMRRCCLIALPDATRSEIRQAEGRALMVLGWQLGFTHSPINRSPLAATAVAWFGGREAAVRAFGTLKGLLEGR